MSSLQKIFLAASELQAFLLSHHFRFCFIGGIAVQRWGMPRFTQVVDATLLADLGEEISTVDSVLNRYAERRPNARQFAIDHHVILARTAEGVDLDLALGFLDFERRSVERATPWNAQDAISLITCSAEDLVIHKAFAARDRDWSDVEGVLARQNGKLNLARIGEELSPLLELAEKPEAMDRLVDLIKSVNKRTGSA